MAPFKNAYSVPLLRRPDMASWPSTRLESNDSSLPVAVLAYAHRDLAHQDRPIAVVGSLTKLLLEYFKKHPMHDDNGDIVRVRFPMCDCIQFTGRSLVSMICLIIHTDGILFKYMSYIIVSILGCCGS